MKTHHPSHNELPPLFTDSLKTHLNAALIFLFLLILFYPALFLAKAAPLTGDHFEQHYPWAWLLSQYLKQGKLPFWTPALQCGFPIAAESQIGIFYPLNLILYALLPFKWAYSYMNLIHFFISGWFTYLYARKMNLSWESALMAGILFLFGGAIGGAYYNMTSLKTIAWFPVALFTFECFLQRRQYFWILLTGAAIGSSMVAGYLQMAVFTWFIFAIYALLRVFCEFKTLHTFVGLALSGLIGVLLTVPQLILTYPLSIMSNRSGLTEEFAYIGSLSPFALITWLNPTGQYIFHGNNFYCGVITVFFILAGIFTARNADEQKVFKLWTIIACVSIALALGEWSPIYRLIIKLTHFYSFRVPAKFIGFILFATSMIGGIGFGKIVQLCSDQKETPEWLLKSIAAWKWILGIYLSIAAGTYLLIKFGLDYVLKPLATWYVKASIYGKAGHPHSYEEYLSRIPSLFEGVLKLYDMTNFENLRCLCLLILGVFFIGILTKQKRMTRSWFCFALCFFLIDLYSYSWIDIKQDFTTYKKAYERLESPVIKHLLQEQKQGRVQRIYGFRNPNQSLPTVPSVNLLLGISDIGIYTPLVSKRYYETIGQFGNINDSIVAKTPSAEWLSEHIPLLSALGVSHIISSTPIDMPVLKLLVAGSNPNGYLYQNISSTSYSTFFWTHQMQNFSSWEELRLKLMDANFDPRATLLLESSELIKFSTQILKQNTTNASAPFITQVSRSDHSVRWEVSSDHSGFFVFMNTYYPGWKARLDGIKKPILKAYGLFQAVYIEQPGHHSLSLDFTPAYSFKKES